MNGHALMTAQRWRMLAVVATAQLCGMSLWFSASAVAPELAAELGLSAGATTALTLAVQLGFVAGTLASAVFNLADLVSARVLICAGSVIGAGANAAVTQVDSWAAVTTLRFVTGATLAAVYPPGMKLAASWFHTSRGLALGLLIAALTFGKAMPYLLSAVAGGQWRASMLTASLLALVGGAIVLAFGRSGPYLAATSRFNPRAIAELLRERGVRLATLGYLGHMWELYAMWTWVAVLATASFASAHVSEPSSAGAVAGFMAIASGGVGCAIAGWQADRVGNARVAIWAMWTSALCAAAVPLLFGGPPLLFFLLIALWGFSVVADSAQFSTIVSRDASREHVGTALTLQTCLGFLLTLVTIEGLPRLAEVVGWRYAPLLLVPGPLLGIAAMRRVR